MQKEKRYLQSQKCHKNGIYGPQDPFRIIWHCRLVNHLREKTVVAARPDSSVQSWPEASPCKPKATYIWRGMLIDMFISKKQTIDVTRCSSSAVGIVSKVSNAPRTKIAPGTETHRLWHKELLRSTRTTADLLAQPTNSSTLFLARGAQWNPGPPWQQDGSHPVLLITMSWQVVSGA